MKFRTLISALASGQLLLLLQLGSLFRERARSSFVAAALAEGVYSLLRGSPASLDQIHQSLLGLPSAELRSAGSQASDDSSKEKLRTWLELGVMLGELKLTPAGYALHGRLSRQLAKPSNDAVAAMYQETCTLHHDLITHTPARLREKRPFTLADTDGKLIARSSRILEPFIFEVTDAVVPAKGACRLLEVGCGSGVYIQRACRRNPDLQAVGLELQPAVAEFARQNLQAWGLAERAIVHSVDVRKYVALERFNLVTLHNNIYYFPVPERLDLLRRLGNFLNPGGKLLVTTACRGFLPTQTLNLWAEMTEGTGPLPEPGAMCDLLRQAGFTSLQKSELLPGQNFFAFVGAKG